MKKSLRTSRLAFDYEHIELRMHEDSRHLSSFSSCAAVENLDLEQKDAKDAKTRTTNHTNCTNEKTFK